MVGAGGLKDILRMHIIINFRMNRKGEDSNGYKNNYGKQNR